MCFFRVADKIYQTSFFGKKVKPQSHRTSALKTSVLFGFTIGFQFLKPRFLPSCGQFLAVSLFFGRRTM